MSHDTDPTADQAVAALAASSAEHLAGVIATGMLDTVGQPARLPELLWPEADPALVRAVWDLALATGYRGGQLAGRPRWAAEELARARDALDGAGFAAMAALVGRAAGTVRPRAVDPHPADAPEAAARGAHQ
jgi:hypothetical protein